MGVLHWPTKAPPERKEWWPRRSLCCGPREGKFVVDFTSDNLCDALVIDAEGNEIGTLVRIYVHPVHRSPQWASVRMETPGSAKSFVPLDGAQWDGVHLRVAINKFLIVKAPHLNNQDDAELTETDSDSLDEYYAISKSTDRCEVARLRDDAPTHHARAPDPTVAWPREELEGRDREA